MEVLLGHWNKRKWQVFIQQGLSRYRWRQHGHMFICKQKRGAMECPWGYACVWSHHGSTLHIKTGKVWKKSNTICQNCYRFWNCRRSVHLLLRSTLIYIFSASLLLKMQLLSFSAPYSTTLLLLCSLKCNFSPLHLKVHLHCFSAP
jgi:hypothetical protein